MRDAAWAARAGVSPARRGVPPRGGQSGLVVVSRITGSELAEIKAEAAASKAASIAGLRPRRVDPLLDAWVTLIGDHMDTSGAGFFTGTYSDPYGYAHGCMLGRNVLKDFQRFLKEQGIENAPWVCCAEIHDSGRDILHLHALIGDLADRADRKRIESAWTHTRGWSSCHPLLDGGVRYCGKYAMKSYESSVFDWSWAS